MPRTRVSSVSPSPADQSVHPETDPRPKNRLLAALPAEDFRRMLPDLKTVPIRAKQVLHKQGDPPEHVYFPNGGVCSVTTVLSDGTSVEAATVGDEGMLGIEVFFGEGATAPGETLMQVPDTDAKLTDTARCTISWDAMRYAWPSHHPRSEGRASVMPSFGVTLTGFASENVRKRTVTSGCSA